MAVTAALVTGTLPTTGSVDMTSPGFGTPDCAIVMASEANTTSNPATHLNISLGLVALSSACTANRQRHGASNADAYRHFDNRAITIISPTNSETEIQYGGSLISDGIRFTVETGSTTVQRYCQAMLIRGVKNIAQGTTTLTGTTPVAVSTGFRPTAVFVLDSATNSPPPILNSGCITSFGIVHWNNAGTRLQRCISYSSANATSVATVNSSLWHTSCAKMYFNNGAYNRTAHAQSPTSSGFEFVAAESANNHRLAWIAIELNDHDQFYLGTQDCSTSNNPQNFTGLKFQPVAMGLMSTMMTFMNSTYGTSTGGISFGMASGPSAQASIVVCDKDGVTPMVASSRWDGSNILNLRNHEDAVDAVGALSQFNPNGYTINYSDTPSSAWKLMVWAIGADASGGTAPTLSDLQAVNITSSSVQATYDYAF